MELFKEVFNQPELLITFAFDMLSISKDLPVNMTDITDEETERAIKARKNNKAAALDEISAELLKHGGPTTGALTSLMNSCWKEKCVPGDWRKGVTIKLPKKGDISHCNNYREKNSAVRSGQYSA